MSKEEVLSQDEVDALLTGVEDGEVETEGGASVEGEIKQLDFNNQERVIRSQFPVLDRLHERAAKKLPVRIYDLMGREIEASVTPLHVQKVVDFITTLKAPMAINIVRMHPLRGKALLIFDEALVFSIVENYFGGDGRFKISHEDREFTESEIRVVHIIMNEIIRELEAAWSPIKKLSIEVMNTEMNPSLVNIGAGTDLIVVSTFEIKFGEEGGGQFTVAIPYTMVDPIREQLELGVGRDDDEVDPNWIKSIEEEMMDVPLEVSSILTQTTISLRDLSHFEKGDIIPVELPDEIVVSVGGIPTYAAKYGVSNDKCALKITNIIKR